jgi:YhcH/YjgK/YiaL family protein
MIIDKIENSYLYATINPLLAEGLKFLSENDFNQISTGKFYLNRHLLIAQINNYPTRPPDQCKLESHRKYIDIHYMVRGEEKIGFTLFNDQKQLSEYDIENDVIYYNGNATIFTLHERHFAIFFPDDLHQPCIMVNEVLPVRKVVVKVAV